MPGGAWETLFVRVRGDSDLQKTFAKDEKAAGKLDKTLGSVFKKYSDRKVSLQVEEDGAAKTAAALKGVDKVADSVDGRSVDIDVDKDGSALKGVEGLSSGFKGLAGNIRATGTVLSAASIPFAIAGIGAGTPTILALGSSFAGLALNLGKAAAGFGLVAGAAGGGALVGLKTYTALLSSTVKSSQEAFEATHEHAVALAEQRRQTTLNTQASKDFNYELLDLRQGFAELQAAVGNKAFPLFTREMDYWGEVLDANRGKIAATAGEVARIAVGFAEWFRTAEEGKVLDRTLGFINSSAIKGASVLHNVGITGVMAFQPLIPLATRLQTDIMALANTTAEWTKSAEGQKRLSQIYTSLWEDAKRLGPVLMDLGRGLFNIFSAIDKSGLSDQASRGLESIASSFEHVTSEGTESRRKIDGFLNSARELMPHVAGAATALWKQIFRVADATVDARQEGHKLTILQEIFDGIRDSAKPLGNLLVGTFKDLGPEIADLLPNLAQLAETFAGSSGPLTTFVRTLNRALELFSKLPDPVKHAAANLVAMKLILGSMGVGAVVGPLGNLVSNMWAVNRVTGAINGKKGLSAVAGSLSRIGLMLAGGIGLAAVAGAFYLAYTRSDKFHDAVNGLAKDLSSWGKDKFKEAKAAVLDIFDFDKKAQSQASDFGVKGAHQMATKFAEQQRKEAANQTGEGSASYEFGFKVGKSIGLAIDAALSGKAGKGGKGTGADNPIGNWLRARVPGAAWLDDNVADPIMKGISQGFQKSKAGKNLFDWIGKQWRETGKLKYEGSPLQQLFKKILNDSDKTKKGATKDAWDLKRQSIAAWTAQHADAIPIFGKLAALIAGKTAEAKTKGTQNAWALKQQSGRAYTAQYLDAVPVFGKILELIVTKTAEAESKGTKNAWDQKRGTTNAWQATLDAAPIWLRIAEAVIDPTRNVVTQVKTAWSDLLNFLADVVSRLGFKDLAASIRGSVPAGKGSSYGGSAPGGDNPNTGTVEHFARGGIHKADRGGVAGPGRMGLVGEAGEREAIVNLDRKTPESQMAFREAARSPNARGGRHAPNRGHEPFALFASGGVWYPKTAAVNSYVEGHWPVQGSTYPGHGADGDAKNSVDWMTGQGWGVAATGEFLARGNAIVDYLTSAQKSFTDYIIWQGKMLDSGGWSTYTGGGGYPAPTTVSGHHLDHVHWESLENNPGPPIGSGGSSGPISVPNPVQILYDKLWPKVESMAKGFFSPLTSSSQILSQVAGKISQSAVDKFGQMLDEKIPDTIGGGSGTGGTYTGGGSLDQWLAAGLKLGGAFPANASNVAKLHSLAMEESTGDPNAVNDLPGNNDPSGLLQVKPTTFRSYMVPGHGNIFDPEDNTAASTRYQKAQYGTLQSHAPYARGGIATGPGIVGEAGDDEAIINLSRKTRESQMAFRAAAKSPNAFHGFARGGISGAPTSGWNLIHGDGALGISGPASNAAMQAAAMWGATGVRFTSGGDVMASWSPGKAAGTTSTSGRMRIDPQFAGMPIAPALWAHEIGHALGLAHNSFGIMRPSVGAGFRPTSSEIDTVRRLYGGQAQMGEGAHGGPGGAPGGIPTGSGGGYGGGYGGGSVNRNSIHMSGGGGTAKTFSSQGASSGRARIEGAVAGWANGGIRARAGNAEANIERGARAGEAQVSLLKEIREEMRKMPHVFGGALRGKPGQDLHRHHQAGIREKLDAAGVR